MDWKVVQKCLMLHSFILLILVMRSAGQGIIVANNSSLEANTATATTTTAMDTSTTTTTAMDTSTTTTTTTATDTTTTPTDSSSSTTTIDIMSVTSDSINALFDNPNNPTRLVSPSGGVTIEQAIQEADNLLTNLQSGDTNNYQVQELTQKLGLAKGLQMLIPYFTDLTMTTPSALGQAGTDLSTTNSSIHFLGVTNPTYKQTLSGLIALLGQGSSTTNASSATSTSSATGTSTLSTTTTNSNSTNSTDSTDSSSDSGADLEALRMLLRTKLDRRGRGDMFSDSPEIDGNDALYRIRRRGMLPPGRYTLNGVPNEDYHSVNCILYDDNGNQINDIPILYKPGYCDVDGTSYPYPIKELVMRVHGRYSAPIGGSILYPDGYPPLGEDPLMRNILGAGGSPFCQVRTVVSNSDWLAQQTTDPVTGALIWMIVPDRYGLDVNVQIRSVLVTPAASDIMSVLVTPYTGLNIDSLTPLLPIQGQANLKITGLTTNEGQNIYAVQVTMIPLYPGTVPNGPSVDIEYCTRLLQPIPSNYGAQPYYIQGNAVSVDNQYLNNIINGQQPNTRTIILNSGQQNPSTTPLCTAPQTISSVNSPNIFQPGYSWLVNIGQNYNTPPLVNSIQIIPQGTFSSGPIKLTLIGANGQIDGPYSTQMDSSSSLTFSNFQSIPVSTAQIDLPPGIPPNGVAVMITTCPSTNAPSNTRAAPVPQPIYINAPSPSGPQSGYSPNPNQQRGSPRLAYGQSGGPPAPFLGMTNPNPYGPQPPSGSQPSPGSPSPYGLQPAPQPQPQYGQQPSSFGQSILPGQTLNNQNGQQPPSFGQAILPGQTLNNQNGQQPPLFGQAILPGQTLNNQNGQQPPLFGQAILPGQTLNNQNGQQPPLFGQAILPGQTLNNQNGQQPPLFGQAILPGQTLNNQNGQQPPSFGQSILPGQTLKNQTGTNSQAPPLTMQYSDEEVPCTLYLIRPGSRRIVANNADGQRVTWVVQVPQKQGYIAVPNCVSAMKTPLSQLGVNYLNTDQSPASMPNGTALQFVSQPNSNDIGSFPEHVPSQMLQVNIDGASPPLPPPSLEVHMIICYEPLSQTQRALPPSQYQPQQPIYPSQPIYPQFQSQPQPPYPQPQQPLPLPSQIGSYPPPSLPYPYQQPQPQPQPPQTQPPYPQPQPQQPYPQPQPSQTQPPYPQPQPQPQLPQPQPQLPQPQPQLPQPQPQLPQPQQPYPQPQPQPQPPQTQPPYPQPQLPQPQQPYPQPQPQQPQQPLTLPSQTGSYPQPSLPYPNPQQQPQPPYPQPQLQPQPPQTQQPYPQPQPQPPQTQPPYPQPQPQQPQPQLQPQPPQIQQPYPQPQPQPPQTQPPYPQPQPQPQLPQPQQPYPQPQPQPQPPQTQPPYPQPQLPQPQQPQQPLTLPSQIGSYPPPSLPYPYQQPQPQPPYQPAPPSYSQPTAPPAQPTPPYQRAVPPSYISPGTPSTAANAGYCSCTCQCPVGAPQPQIQGAAVSYVSLAAQQQQQQQQYGRRRRRQSDSSYDLNIRKE